MNHQYLDRRLRKVLAFFYLACLLGCSPQNHWSSLLSNDLSSDWDTYLGSPFDSLGNRSDQAPQGLNYDPDKVFSVNTDEPEPVLRISGERFGGISTKKEFSNYHLRLDFRWGAAKHHPRKNAKRDSGLLYHAGGDHGADYGFWLRSQEFQIQEGDCGDYWGVAGGSFEVPARKVDSTTFIYSQGASPLLFNEKSPNGRRCVKGGDAENQYGEWNSLELYCYGDTAVHIVNGKVVMVLFNSSVVESNALKPLKHGKIQLQSEGAELFVRRIDIRNISGIPEELLK